MAGPTPSLQSASIARPLHPDGPALLTTMDLARLIREICESSSAIELRPLPIDNPRRRCPDVSLANSLLGWKPTITLDEGLRRTAAWWRTQEQLADDGVRRP
jgi:nucleoside-diphosphate-sugar epimerase